MRCAFSAVQPERVAMIFRPLSIAFGILLAYGRPQFGQAAQPASEARAVYAALLDTVFRGKVPDTLVVGDSSFAVPESFGAQKIFLDFPERLVGDLARLSTAIRATSSLDLPIPVNILTRAQLSALVAPDGVYWKPFYSRYPNAGGSFRFSPVVF